MNVVIASLSVVAVAAAILFRNVRIARRTASGLFSTSRGIISAVIVIAVGIGIGIALAALSRSK